MSLRAPVLLRDSAVPCNIGNSKAGFSLVLIEKVLALCFPN